MNVVRPCLLLVLLLCPAAFAGAPLLAPDILAELPHDREAFTEGLLLRDGLFLESVGKYGRSELRRVDPVTGAVLRRTPLAAKYFAEGLTLHDGRLVLLTWKEGTGFFLDPGTLRITGSFVWQGEGWGLTSDGTRLWASDGSDSLRLLDPARMTVLRRIPVRDGDQPVLRLNELEAARGVVWANVWWEDRVAAIAPDSGKVLAWLDLKPLRARLENPGAESANGLACDPESGRLYVTGKFWDKVFVLRLPALP
ncbi:MAG TPA: glutaminyl-peptide cyclotransferase [Desulfovibrio sp.]|jgi:glutamine cyclotransferase|uniref:glutaminyl-peptide cyclotransferase n=1 Tax=Desulfovibrio TaxID=872 RepID=UPI00041B1B75|nr:MULTISPECIES: glutaminyl-peptide cyclotransferase [Desulfovibrio]MDY0306273.1 glutaminyl-peptide cyclotransferase [Desulfovibrionaceae bacterium]HMM39203.1 glutaminyl-peptide cyclotransferase [Desulfovibrio sp.]